MSLTAETASLDCKESGELRCYVSGCSTLCTLLCTALLVRINRAETFQALAKISKQLDNLVLGMADCGTTQTDKSQGVVLNAGVNHSATTRALCRGDKFQGGDGRRIFHWYMYPEAERCTTQRSCFNKYQAVPHPPRVIFGRCDIGAAPQRRAAAAEQLILGLDTQSRLHHF